ncbi:MAG: hypothetical protein OXS29_01690 [bacterium]|nr:hypothetical protein [bacterium]MDE0289214.1 hypothetical protein [bacterium]MDE0437113.1 hypothetical protein [bacterium]
MPAAISWSRLPAPPWPASVGAKLDAPLSLRFESLYAHDLAGRAEAFPKLAAGGMAIPGASTYPVWRWRVRSNAAFTIRRLNDLGREDGTPSYEVGSLGPFLAWYTEAMPADEARGRGALHRPPGRPLPPGR